MKKRKKLYAVIGITALAALGMTGAYAYFSDRVEVENRIQLGDINVGLETYMKDDTGREKPYEYKGVVLPSQTVSEIPRITNIAEPCYVRALITYENDLEEEGLSDENLNGISGEWIKIGDYYYLKDVLETDESADLFESVTFPAEWENPHSGQNLDINIQVDAIQAKNYKPDYQSEKPWGDEEIEVCVHTGHEENLVNPYSTMYVEFEGNSHKLLAVPDDFFANLGQAMPGDELEDTVTLRNTTNREAEFFFKTALPGLTEAQKSLVEKMSLTITLDGKELYRGSLEAASLQEKISLGTCASGAEKKFAFAVGVPAELKNQYALADTAVRWIFSVQQDEVKVKTVKTGDESMAVFYLMWAGLAGTFLLMIMLKKRKERAYE